MNSTVTANSLAELSTLWEVLFPTVETPSQSQLAIWLARYDAPIVRAGLGALAVKYLNVKGEMSFEHLVRFGSSVMSRLWIESQARQHAQFNRSIQQ
jgi:hypothetical protein